MTDVNFALPAQLLTAKGQIGLPSTPQDGPVDQGSLGRLVGKVMDTAPDERAHYFIFANGGLYLHASEIEALANTRRYTDWHAGQV